MARVVVKGGGLAGSATAVLLAKDGHDVVVLERDPAPPPADAESAWNDWRRVGVGQFRQAYGIQPRLTRLLEAELPEVNRHLERLGALRLPWRSQLEPHFPERAQLMTQPDYLALTARRPTMELAFASTVAEQPGVELRRGVGVAEFVLGAPAVSNIPHIAGVRTEAGDVLLADLVIDASGRATSLPVRLASLGCRPPLETQLDNSSIYYSRFYQSPTGEHPEFGGGPLFLNGQGIGLFLIPADNGTWCLSVWGLAEDKVLRPLRDPDRFDAVVSHFPEREEWLRDGVPISDVMPCVSGGDLNRSFVIDDVPVATGVLAVGDTHAFTEPRMGRGTLFSVMQSCALRDAVRDHLDAGPVQMAQGWEHRFETVMRPYLNATNGAGKTFAREARSYLGDGVPAFDATNRGAVLNRAFEQAAQVDLTVGCWLLDLAGAEVLPQELLTQPGAVDRILEYGDHEPASERPGPSRAQLLDIVTAA